MRAKKVNESGIPWSGKDPTKAPVIGKVITKSMNLGDYYIPSSEMNVVEISDDIYICDTWYKPYVPQVIHKNMVQEFIPINEMSNDNWACGICGDKIINEHCISCGTYYENYSLYEYTSEEDKMANQKIENWKKSLTGTNREDEVDDWYLSDDDKNIIFTSKNKGEYKVKFKKLINDSKLYNKIIKWDKEDHTLEDINHINNPNTNSSTQELYNKIDELVNKYDKENTWDWKYAEKKTGVDYNWFDPAKGVDHGKPEDIGKLTLAMQVSLIESWIFENGSDEDREKWHKFVNSLLVGQAHVRKWEDLNKEDLQSAYDEGKFLERRIKNRHF